jgi:hypothetical protein
MMFVAADVTSKDHLLYSSQQFFKASTDIAPPISHEKLKLGEKSAIFVVEPGFSLLAINLLPQFQPVQSVEEWDKNDVFLKLIQ